jgi:hypothetical protein
MDKVLAPILQFHKYKSPHVVAIRDFHIPEWGHTLHRGCQPSPHFHYILQILNTMHAAQHLEALSTCQGCAGDGHHDRVLDVFVNKNINKILGWERKRIIPGHEA